MVIVLKGLFASDPTLCKKTARGLGPGGYRCGYYCVLHAYARSFRREQNSQAKAKSCVVEHSHFLCKAIKKEITPISNHR